LYIYFNFKKWEAKAENKYENPKINGKREDNASDSMDVDSVGMGTHPRNNSIEGTFMDMTLNIYDYVSINIEKVPSSLVYIFCPGEE